jgi:predicted site-specific integrase-resolvase
LNVKLLSKPKSDAADTEILLTGKELQARWKCHAVTIQRWVEKGILRPIMIGSKFRRYRLSDIQRIEAEAMPK